MANGLRQSVLGKRPQANGSSHFIEKNHTFRTNALCALAKDSLHVAGVSHQPVVLIARGRNLVIDPFKQPLFRLTPSETLFKSDSHFLTLRFIREGAPDLKHRRRIWVLGLTGLK